MFNKLSSDAYIYYTPDSDYEFDVYVNPGLSKSNSDPNISKLEELKEYIKDENQLKIISLQFDAMTALDEGRYSDALEGFKKIRKDFYRYTEASKNALYNLGYTYFSFLNDTDKGLPYFAELSEKHPDDMLTEQARQITNVEDFSPFRSLESDIIELTSNFPNPFNPTTTINYKVHANENVSLKVFDTSGREVSVLVNGYKEKGSYSVDFNGEGLSSGVYIYMLQVGDKAVSRKMLLIK